MASNDFVLGVTVPASDRRSFRHVKHTRQVPRDQLVVQAVEDYLAEGAPPVERKQGESTTGFKGPIWIPHELTFQIKAAAGDRHPVDFVGDAISHFARKQPPVVEPASVIPPKAAIPVTRGSALGFLKLGGRGFVAGAAPQGA